MTETTNPRIEHVVVLMLENRSFDHMLGFLAHPNPAFEGLVGKDAFNELANTRYPATNTGVPAHMDPDHSHESIQVQLGAHGAVPFNGGFVVNYEARRQGDGHKVMACLEPTSQCQVLATLASEFAVCDRWHCSVPGETWPNRNFAHAGTSDGSVNIELGFFYDTTIFELITKAGGSWHIYMDGVPQVWCFRRLWRTRTILDFLLRRPARIGNFFDMPFFATHAAEGSLPQYSFIEPRHNTFNDWQRRPTNSQHPGNNDGSSDDFFRGEDLVRDVYQALLANPTLFEKTLLIVTYDEHGGFYDHVRTPGGMPPGDPIHRGITRRIGRFVRHVRNWIVRVPKTPAFDFTRLGVRVPTVLVSPWIAPGTLVQTQFDHASIPATLRRLFAPGAKPLSDRDQSANTFDWVVNSERSAPRTNPRSPDGGGGDDTLPDFGVTPEAPRLEAARADTGMGPLEELSHEHPTELDEQLVKLAKRVQRRVGWRPTVIRQRRRRLATLGAEGFEVPPRPGEPDTVTSFLELAHQTRHRERA